jgi:K+-transporting ATPase KdpF subunit
MPKIEVGAMHSEIVTIVGFVLSVLLLGYLTLTLLFPEKF